MEKQDISTYLHYNKWILDNVILETNELDQYIQEKAKELIQKFQDIAKSSIQQAKTSKDQDSMQIIVIAGQDLTYSQATVELKRLTSSLVKDEGASFEKTLLKKKIAEMIKALSNHAESSENLSKQTKESVEDVKKNVMDIIIAFQFQDFVTQHIEHINTALSTLNNKTTEMIDKIAPDTSRETEIPSEMAEELLNQFSLSKIQKKYMDSLGSTVNVTPIEADEDDDIELF